VGVCQGGGLGLPRPVTEVLRPGGDPGSGQDQFGPQPLSGRLLRGLGTFLGDGMGETPPLASGDDPLDDLRVLELAQCRGVGQVQGAVVGSLKRDLAGSPGEPVHCQSAPDPVHGRDHGGCDLLG
jgi:hypothetical protein